MNLTREREPRIILYPATHPPRIIRGNKTKTTKTRIIIIICL
jgi:hypothetical protein